MGIIFVSVFYTDQQATVLVSDQAISGNIENGISDLNNIADLYFLYQQDSQLTDWQSNITVLYSYISQLKSTDSNQNKFSDTLTVDVQNVDSAFNNTIAYLEKTPRNVTVRTDPAFQDTWSQLSDALQAFSSDTTQLSQSLHIQSNALDTSNIILIITLLIAFALFSIVSYFIMFRRTLTTISELDKNIKIIGTGNFDQQVKTSKNDELGELSSSINDMRVQLKKITAQLKEQERLVGIGQTAGMVGHDLRSPLQSIAGEVYMAEEEIASFPNGQTKEKISESIQVIDEQIKYMDKIISDLQSFVKPVEPQKETVNLKKLVSNVLSLIKIPENIKLTLNFSDEFTVLADPQLLKRVLINLVNNAVQAMSKGGTLNILGKSTVKGKTQVIIEDNGVGIPDEIKAKIFTPLFTTKPRGQGFGLAVCKRVIEAQGGTISFESQEGQGTSFTVELPQL
jgi:signal transduction histidine kinase